MIPANLQFHNPESLWLLLVIPAWILWRAFPLRPATLHFASADLLRDIKEPRRGTKSRILFLLRMSAVALVIVAIARPQIELTKTVNRIPSMDTMIILHLSKPDADNPWKIVANALPERLIKQDRTAPDSDRLGIIAAGETPTVISPLTKDPDWFRTRLGEALKQDSVAPLDSALSALPTRMPPQEKRVRIGIILSDQSTGPIPLKGVRTLQSTDIKLHSIQLSSFKKLGSLENVGKALTIAAAESGGQYFQASDERTLASALNQIRQIEKAAPETVRDYKELYYWFVIAALALFLTEFTLSYTLWKRLP